MTSVSNMSSKGSNVTNAWCGNNCTQLIVFIIMLTLFAMIGTVGNALVIYVFGRRKEKLTSTMFILALAITDFTTSLLIMPFTIYGEVIDFEFSNDFVCKLYSFCITFGVPCSCFIMVAIAVDRYFCICHPFAHAINVKRAQIMLLGIVSFACFLGILTSLTVGTYNKGYVTHEHNCTNNVNESMSVSQTKEGRCFVNISSVVHMGQCKETELIVSTEVTYVYNKMYSSLYIISVLIVIVLYCLIYQSVRTRRAMRSRLRGTPTNTLIQNQTHEVSYVETQMTVLNGHEEETEGDKTGSKRVKKRQTRSARDRNKVANLKTAFMLFVVTTVFIIAFAPAWMMAQHIAPVNLIVFYMYFIYNASNPVIYAFLNQSFRDDLSQIFRCKIR